MFIDELEANNIKLEIDDKRNNYGGNPEKRISTALKNIGKYEIVIAWLDNDLQITKKDILKQLEKFWCINRIDKEINLVDLKQLNTKSKNPIIILSMPLTIENVIIEALGKRSPKYKSEYTLGKNVDFLKDALSGIWGVEGCRDEYSYYVKNLTKENILKRAPKINSLDELFKILKLYD